MNSKKMHGRSVSAVASQQICLAFITRVTSTVAMRLLIGLAVCQLVACNRSPATSTGKPSTQTTLGQVQAKAASDAAPASTIKLDASSSPTTITAAVARYVAQPFAMPVVNNPGYVGFDKCSECHAKRVTECVDSSHFQTCRQPDLKRIPAAFTSSNPEDRTLELPGTDISFTMSVEDGKFLQTATRKSTGERTVSTIDWIYGAKPTSDEVYLSWHADDSMWELPAAWLYSHDCWGAAGFDRTQGTDFARELTVRCFECHTTWFEHVPGTLSTYRREGLLPGVTCERCHGPGQQHVDYHRTHPTETKSQHILFPGSLPRERLIDVCIQCHSNSIRHKGPALSYRPGQPLADHYRSVTPKFSEDDHVADQITHLRQSKCFQKSEMSCITCHDPHLTSQAPHGTTFQAACAQCHDTQACKQRDQIPAPVADKCVECHMRKFAKVNVNFDTAHDAYVPPVKRSQHNIAVDQVATREVLWAWYRTQTDNASQARTTELLQWLTEHWTADGASLAKAGRFTAASAAMRELLRVNPDSSAAQQLLQQYTKQQREFDDLVNQAEHMRRASRDTESIALFQKVLSIRPDNAKAIGRIGAIYTKLGDRAQAESYLQRVAQVDPDDQYGLSIMAWTALNSGQFDRAAKLYEQADAIEPFNSKLNGLWGNALVKAGRAREGVARLLIACQVDPKNLQAARELATVHLDTQDFAVAESWAIKAVQLTNHQSVPDLMVLAECFVSQNNQIFATDVATLAVQVAQRIKPQVAQEIRSWAAARGLELIKTP